MYTVPWNQTHDNANNRQMTGWNRKDTYLSYELSLQSKRSTDTRSEPGQEPCSGPTRWYQTGLTSCVGKTSLAERAKKNEMQRLSYACFQALEFS